MHLSRKSLHNPHSHYDQFRDDMDLDSEMFYSVPTSFHVIDERIPRILREPQTAGARQGTVGNGQISIGKPGFRKTIEGRAEADYLVAQIQALMMAMAAESPRGPPSPKAKGSPRADRTR